MDTYPEWYGKFFPTLAACEPDHFYGYMQSPEGKVKAVLSADPIASWSLDYNMGYPDYTQDNRWFYGHRIECLSLDMLYWSCSELHVLPATRLKSKYGERLHS